MSWLEPQHTANTNLCIFPLSVVWPPFWCVCSRSTLPTSAAINHPFVSCRHSAMTFSDLLNQSLIVQHELSCSRRLVTNDPVLVIIQCENTRSVSARCYFIRRRVTFSWSSSSYSSVCFVICCKRGNVCLFTAWPHWLAWTSHHPCALITTLWIIKASRKKRPLCQH